MILPMPDVKYRRYVDGKPEIAMPRKRSNEFILKLCLELDLFILVSKDKDSVMLRAYIRSQPSRCLTFYSWDVDDYFECPTLFRKIRKLLDEKC